MPGIPDFVFEKSLLPSGCRYLLGIDEVGRGPWAGPVTVAGFVLDLNNFDQDFFIKLKVRDSKTLNDYQRQKIASKLQLQPFTIRILSASSEVIDQQGIGVTIENLMHRILTDLDGQFDFALIDGNLKIPHPRCLSVIDADARCFSVAAASVCAKVARDKIMDDFDLLYPHYDFKNNKGYGTKKHQQGLNDHGICPIHRLSYKPIKNFVKPFSQI
ncbi:MAG TPA: ribonuclease HII [Patescibacteria group bacterium]